MTIFADEQEKTAATPPGKAHLGKDGTPLTDYSQSEHIVLIVACSLGIGVLAAGLLVAAPLIPATESGVIGAILLGLTLGWTILAALSVKFTNQPQKWAIVPALFMSLGGFLLLTFGPPVQGVLAWIWPPAALMLAVWMLVMAHRKLRSRSGRVLLYPAVAALFLASLGGGYATVHEVVDAGASPSQGRLIDVGGHRLYLNCTGSGGPTVVLEPGAGMMSSDLSLIAPAVGRDTRVCVYDRAGRGWSDSAETTQDGVQIATGLHTLLQRADEPGPYVLAGHSFGGLYALTFAALYPDDVAGLVLVDSTAPASQSVPDATPPTIADSDDAINRVSALGAAAARLGLGLIVGVDDPSHLRGTIDEYLHAATYAQQAAELRDFADKPLLVLTADAGSQPGWDASQDALASLSTNSLHRVINGATHASFISDEQDAAATTRGILDIVSAVRTANPLAP